MVLEAESPKQPGACSWQSPVLAKVKCAARGDSILVQEAREPGGVRLS